MSAKLANAPVYYALIQVRFNAVALMAKFAEEVQDRLRRSGFPIFEMEQTQSIEFGDLTQIHEAKPIITETPNWFFTSEDKYNGYVLGKDFFSFQTTQYDTHESFFKRFCDGLLVLNEIVGIGAISRLGLRYLDAVIPEENESVNLFLHQQVQGVDFGHPWLGGAWESAFKTDDGMLVSKIYKTSSSLLGFPVDLQPRSVILDDKFSFDDPKEHAVIDIDHFTQETMRLDLAIINDKLTSLHSTLNECFSAIATEHAFQRWS